MWSFETAQHDKEQRRMMDGCMNRRDWNFLSGSANPREVDEHHYKRKPFPGANLLIVKEPSLQTKKYCNYKVLLPRDYESKEPIDEHGDEPAKWLASLRIWKSG